ncbi:hypothetical protein D3C78_523930 [compost metagenome]
MHPRCLEAAQLFSALLQYSIDQRLRFLGAVLNTLTSKQRAHPRQQRIRADPVTAHPGQGVTVHAVAKTSPVIAHDLAEQLAVIGFQGLGEQAAAVKCMLTQHALTPAVNGRHRRLIHPLRSYIQTVGAGWPYVLWIIVTQLLQQQIGPLQLATEETCSFCQSRTNTFA